MSLPHFTQIVSHNALHEPSYKNLFEAEIILPEYFSTIHGTDATALLLENITSAKMPTYPTIGTVEQRFKYSTRLFVGFPDSTSVTDLTLVLNVNQNKTKQLYTFRMIKDWYDLVWNNEDGSSNYKANIVGDIIIYQHDREGEIIRRVTYHNCQITGFSGMEDLQWGGGAEIHELTATWAADYFEDYYF